MDPLLAILITLLVLALVGAFPRWPYSANWGYGPMGLLAIVLIILLILIILGTIPIHRIRV